MGNERDSADRDKTEVLAPKDLADPARWRVVLTGDGRIAYNSGAQTIPAQAAITHAVGRELFLQAAASQAPYPEAMRPRDVRGEPGSLVLIARAARAIIVGDLHGRFDNLEHILKDKGNLQDILSGPAHVIFTGDAVHPSSAESHKPEAHAASLNIMLLIMMMKRTRPMHVHYLVGNHDNSHIGGAPTGRGRTRQDRLFQKHVTGEFGAQVFDAYCRFVEAAPVVARVETTEGHFLVAHAGVSPRVLNERGLANLLVRGRRSGALQEILWNREQDPERIRHTLATLGARFVVAGHICPTAGRVARYGMEMIAEKVFAHANGLQLVVNAQRNTFGYLDVDLTRPLPERLVDLRAPGGRPAFRVLQPGGLSPKPPPNA